MKCRVKITQVLEGYVDLEVERAEDALALADDMYRRQGMELPDMDDGLPLQFSLEDVLQRDFADTNTVFLVPDDKCNWFATISEKLPADHAIVLTTEQSYPVEIFYDRMDINGSGVTDGYICHDRNELLQTLNWIGQCGHTPLELWGFNIDNPIESDLHDLLKNTYEKKCRLIQNIDWEETVDSDHDTCQTDLDEKLSAAKDVVKQATAANHIKSEQIEH